MFNVITEVSKQTEVVITELNCVFSTDDVFHKDIFTKPEYMPAVAYPGILFGGGVQQIQLRTEDRENGDLGAVAP
jgi:hypothetical protein